MDLVGRDEVVGAFDALVSPRARRWVLLVGGLSGTGKSYLVEWLCANRCAGIPHAWLTLSPSSNVNDLMRDLVTGLGPELAAQYRARNREADAAGYPLLNYAPQASISASMGGKVSEGRQFGELTIDFGSLAPALEIERRSRQMSLLLDILAPLEDQVWILFVDETEHLTDPDLAQILRELVARLRQRFPKFRLYLTGQTVPAHGLGFGLHERARKELTTFSPEASANLLRAAGIDDPALHASAFEITGGHPLLLAMFAEHLQAADDIGAADLMDVRHEFDERARTGWIYDRIIARFQDATLRDTAANLALFDWFDLGLLRTVFGPGISEGGFQDMVARSFVKPIGRGRWRCHDIIRKHLQHQRLSIDPARCREIYGAGFRAYLERLDDGVRREGRHFFDGRLETAVAALHCVSAVSALEAAAYARSEIARPMAAFDDHYLFGFARATEAERVPEAVRRIGARTKLCLEAVNLGNWNSIDLDFLDELATDAERRDEREIAGPLLDFITRICLALDQPDRAVRFAERLAGLQGSLESRVLQATARARMQRFDEAERILADAEATLGDSVDLRVGRAEIAAIGGDRDAVARTYADAIAAFPDTAGPARLRLARLLWIEDNNDAALALLEPIGRGDPIHAEAVTLRFRCLVERGRIDEALEHLVDVSANLAANLNEFLFVARELSHPLTKARLLDALDEDPHAVPIGVTINLGAVLAAKGDADGVERLAAKAQQNSPEAIDIFMALRGMALATAGRPQDAIDVVKPLVDRRAHNVDAYFTLANCYLGIGAYDKARRTAVQAAERFPGLRDLTDAFVFHSFLREKLIEDGVRYLANREHEGPLGPFALMARADYLVATGNLDEAVILLEELVYTQDRFLLPAFALVGLRVKLAQLLIARDRKPAAAEIAEKLLAVFPDQPSAVVGAAGIFLALQDEAGVREAVRVNQDSSPKVRGVLLGILTQMILAQNPSIDSLLAELTKHPQRLELVAALDLLLTLGGQFDDADRVYAKVAEVAPGLLETLIDLQSTMLKELTVPEIEQLCAVKNRNPANTRVRIGYARALAANGQLDRAREELHELLRLAPDQREALTFLETNMLIEAGRLDEAEAFLRPVIDQQAPPSAFTHVTAVTNLFEARGDADAAVRFLTTVAETYPERRGWSLGRQAGFLIRERRFDDALRVLEQLEAEEGLNVPNMLQKGHVLASLGRTDDALRTLDDARARPHIAEDLLAGLLDVRGDILRRAGRLDDALVAYTESIGVAPRLPAPRLGLALVRKEREEWAEAYEAMREAVAFDPALLETWEEDLRSLRAKATTVVADAITSEVQP